MLGATGSQFSTMSQKISASRLFGSPISSKELISVSGVVPKEVVDAFFYACQGNFDLANKEVNNVIAEGYPVSNAFTDEILDEQMARICKKLGEADKCLVDGADEYLQLFDVASSTVRAVCNVQEDFSQEC